MPIMSRWARSLQVPPWWSVTRSRAASQRPSESTRTPSMSKTTASTAEAMYGWSLDALSLSAGALAASRHPALDDRAQAADHPEGERAERPARPGHVDAQSVVERDLARPHSREGEPHGGVDQGQLPAAVLRPNALALVCAAGRRG